MVQAFSIGTGKRSTDQDTTQVPGPGTYKYDKQQRETPPAYKIPLAQRQTFKPNQTPGPGTYKANESSLAPKYTFAGKKNLSHSQLQPGPGTYNPKINKGAPLYSFGAKYASEAPQHQPPGPGAYDRESALDGPSMKFGKSQRQWQQTDRTPGPGQYTNKWRPDSAPKFGFGRSERRELNDTEVKKNPGPGAYDLGTAFEPELKGFTLLSRRTVGDHNGSVPGPGAYDPQRQQRPPSCKIGKQERTTFKIEGTPGPGQYQCNETTIRPNSAMVRIGSAQRRSLNEYGQAPGPGTYEIPTKMIEGPKVSILGHKYDPVQAQKDQVPGPGQYESFNVMRPQSAKQNTQIIRIGTSRRNDFEPTRDQPGPGNYLIPKQKEGPKWGFGTGNRPPLNPKTDTPGPGGYDPPCEFAKVPKYNQRSK